VSCCRQARLAPWLEASALILAVLMTAPEARAQTAAPTDFPPLRPSLDNTPTLGPRKPGTPSDEPVPSRVGQLPTFGPPTFGVTPPPTAGAQPPIGIGATGFDSRNLPKKSAKVAAPGAAALAPTPAAAISEARLPQIQNQTRRGATPVDPNAAPALPAPTLTSPTATLPTNANAAAPLPQNLTHKPRPEDTPFDPLGVTAGSFLLRPAIEVSGGYDTNPARTTSGGGASLFSVVAPELKASSNWLRHELTADLHGSYTTYSSEHQLDRPAFDGKIDGRIDVTTRTKINLESRLIVATDNPGSPNIQVGLAKLPVSTDVGWSLGLAQQFNRFDYTFKGSFDRTTYQQSVFTDGSTSSNNDRNFDQPAVELRANYELTPGVKPFLQFDADRRVHDVMFDNFGFDRDSDGLAGKLGTSFELSRILTGELALGYLSRTYRDPTLPRLAGPTLDSSLTWVASALTTVKLKASTTANETTLAGVSGVFTHEIGIEVDHNFRRWLEATLKFTGDRDNYIGSDRLDYRYALSTALTYKLTREWQLKGELRREWLVSNQPGNDYLAYVALVGVRLQR
jgi:hypothetical protein